MYIYILYYLISTLIIDYNFVFVFFFILLLSIDERHWWWKITTSIMIHCEFSFIFYSFFVFYDYIIVIFQVVHNPLLFYLSLFYSQFFFNYIYFLIPLLTYLIWIISILSTGGSNSYLSLILCTAFFKTSFCCSDFILLSFLTRANFYTINENMERSNDWMQDEDK